jgi:hypothetical protein
MRFKIRSMEKLLAGSCRALSVSLSRLPGQFFVTFSVRGLWLAWVIPLELFTAGKEIPPRCKFTGGI